MTPEERDALRDEVYTVVFEEKFCVGESWKRLTTLKERLFSGVSLSNVTRHPNKYPEYFDALYLELLTMRLEGVIIWPSKTERCSST